MSKRPVTSSAIRRTTRRRSARTTSKAAGAALSLNVAAAHADISSDISFLQSTLDDIQERSSFSEIYEDIIELDTTINSVLDLLEAAREEGYVYQSDMED
ncbi:MAG: hypothetical protein U9Q82_12085, partial [Chloroflexota bacterium]|nr:hypothetical protein [Chloroflexota bacterium]